MGLDDSFNLPLKVLNAGLLLDAEVCKLIMKNIRLIFESIFQRMQSWIDLSVQCRKGKGNRKGHTENLLLKEKTPSQMKVIVWKTNFRISLLSG